MNNTAIHVESIGEVIPYDACRMNLVVSSTVGILPGYQFTIDTINAISRFCKCDTGRLKTFAVLEITDATSMVITPPIIPGEYALANVTQGISGGESITFLNADDMQTKLLKKVCK